ncbi:MAG TPA: hypothetical protein VK404_05340 [Spirosoma sp.]|nr:hypothetical protein [Spirosoma sp.]
MANYFSIAPAPRSDRGVQYACIEFRDQFKELPVLQSMTGLPEQSKG